MKNTLKKTMVIVMAFTLLIGAFAMPTQRAQAASKLTKADFKFTGMYKSLFNTVIEETTGWRYYMSNTIGEDAPKKCIKTKRGITLTSTKQQVFKKYGKTSVKKLGKNTILYEQCETELSAESFQLVQNDKCAMYQYSSGSNKYRLYFFFDTENKVEAIVVSRNC